MNFPFLNGLRNKLVTELFQSITWYPERFRGGLGWMLNPLSQTTIDTRGLANLQTPTPTFHELACIYVKSNGFGGHLSNAHWRDKLVIVPSMLATTPWTPQCKSPVYKMLKRTFSIIRLIQNCKFHLISRKLNW